MELNGVVRAWLTKKGAEGRRYMTVELPYGEARVAFKPDLFKADKGTGEQRGIFDAHLKQIRKAMEGDTYTPTTVSVGLRARHAKAASFSDAGDGTTLCTVTLEDGDSLPLTDGGHRFGAVEAMRADAEARGKAARKAGDAASEAAEEVALLDALPVTAVVHLNGNTQDDFINLQLGKSVDQTHLLSIKIVRKMFGEKDSRAMKLAFDVARLLNAKSDSPFYKQIRFDSKGHAAYPLSSLCPKGSSDLGTSLTGLARVGLGGGKATDAATLAHAVVAACNALRHKAPGLVADGKVLTPPPDGTKGAATMLVGVGLALAYRVKATDSKSPSERDLAQLVAAANETLDRDVNGNFSGPQKRALLGEFVREFFADLKVEKHDGMPKALLETLSPSAFGASKLPPKKKKGLPDVDGPLPDAREESGTTEERVVERDEDFADGPGPELDWEPAAVGAGDEG